MTSAARYLANFVAQSNNILDASIALADLGPEVLANIITAGSELANITTSNITEGVNLYYTNARARAAISVTGTGSYDQANGVINIVGGVESVNGDTGNVVLDTSDIVEGANLYFSNARVFANVIAGGFATESYVDSGIANLVNSAPEALDTLYELANALGNDANFATSISTLIGKSYNQANAAYDEANSKTVAADLTTANVAEVTNLYFTNARVYANVTELGYASNLYVDDRLATKANVTDLTTANVAEDTNLYFTNARAIGSLTAGDGIAIQANGLVVATTDATPTFDSVNVGDLTVSGNLTVTGNLTTINAQTLEIVDPLIKLAANNEISDAVDFGFVGHYSPDAGTTSQHAGMFRDSDNGEFYIFSEYVDAELDSGNLVTNIDRSNNTFKLATFHANIFVGNVTGTVSTLSNHDTTDLAEGSNLYFTNTRAIGALTAGNGITIEANGLVVSSGEASTFTGNTDGVAEGTSNLYFTNARSIAALTGGDNITIESNGLIVGQPGYVDENAYANSQIWFANVTTSNVAEGANLYFTNARVYANVAEIGYAANSYVDDRLSTKANAADLTTSNVAEGANLYFSNDRAIGALTSSDDIIINSNGLLSSNVGAFKTILVSGGANVVAEPNDRIEFVAGAGMTIITNPNVSPKIIAFSANVSGVSGAAGGNLDFGSIVQPVGFTLDLGSII